MDIKFKVRIEIDEDKVLREDLYDLVDIYDAMDRVFKENGIIIVENEGKARVYVTDKNDLYANFWLAILKVEESPIMQYVSVFEWHNYVEDNIEDIIKESREEMKHRAINFDLDTKSLKSSIILIQNVGEMLTRILESLWKRMDLNIGKDPGIFLLSLLVSISLRSLWEK